MIYQISLLLFFFIYGPVPDQKNEGRRLALLVGVGNFETSDRTLGQIPANDVANMEHILGDGYGFTVKKLVDREATLASFRAAFTDFLGKAGPNDLALVYFSGFGSQACDTDGDEIDGMDETLIFYDSRGDPQVGDLVDDEFKYLLGTLKAGRIVVILDACISGSITRDRASIRTKWELAEDCEQVRKRKQEFEGEGAPHLWTDVREVDRLVIFSASSDGLPALTTERSSVFTDALITVLSQLVTPSLTYEQLGRRVQSLVNSFGQKPVFSGKLDWQVFSEKRFILPGWQLAKENGNWIVTGVAFPGWSDGAVIAVYPSAITRPEYFRDPTKALAKFSLEDVTGGKGYLVKPDNVHNSFEKLNVGDRAVLVRPGVDIFQITVRLAPCITVERAEAIKKAINNNSQLANFVLFKENKSADFEVGQDHNGNLRILGPEGKVRIRIKAGRYETSEVAWSLWLQAIQRNLLQLQGETGAAFDDASLKIEIVPNILSMQPSCVAGAVAEVGPTGEVILPMCLDYRVRVTLISRKKNTRLRVGGLILSGDGATFGFPRDGTYPVLAPGQHYTFPDLFRALPPLNLSDHILVFGTSPETLPYLDLLIHSATRDFRSRSNKYNEILNYIVGNRRAMAPTSGNVGWTLSHLSMRVDANPSARLDTIPPGQIISRFDLRPYLPPDPSKALYRILDGLPAQARDPLFSIIELFEQASLPVSNGPLSAKNLAPDTPLLINHFIQKPFWGRHQAGDILVYAGHDQIPALSLLVIDEKKGIAWGVDPEGKTGFRFIPQIFESGQRKLEPLVRWRHIQLNREGPIVDVGGNALIDACDCN